MTDQVIDEIQVAKYTKRDGYIPVSLRCVPLEGLQGLECYIDNQGNFTLYCNSATEFTNEDKNRLLHEGIECLYIEKSKAVNYYRVVQDTLTKIVTNISLPVNIRAQFLYETASVLAENFFEYTSTGQFSMSELYQQVRKVAEAVVEFFVIEEHAFKQIVNIMDHEDSVGCHSANVCFYSIAIAIRLKLLKEDWMALAVGSLFHDLGKARIPPGILHSTDKLTDEQKALVQKHVMLGAEMIKEIQDLDPAIVRLILEHHETLDGKGYPRGLTAKDLSDLGMIISVADVFDAMTSQRSYRQENEPLEIVLSYINDHSYDKYHAPAARALIGIICQNSLTTSLVKRLQEVADTEWEDKFDTPRRHKRHYMRTSVLVREVTREEGKVKLGKSEQFMMSNISRSGFGFLSGRSFLKDTNVCLTLEGFDGPGKDWNALARVVWCEKNISQWYVVGCQFYQIYDKSTIDRICLKAPAKKKK